MKYASKVNNTSTADSWIPSYVIERPISFVATLAFTACGQWIAHKGVFSLMPTEDLAIALSGIFASIAVIQWVGMGRLEACKRLRADKRAREVLTQAFGLGTIEAAIYGVSLIVLAGNSEPLTAPPLAMGAAGVTGAFFAYLNFRMKYVSVDAVGDERPKAAKPSADRIFAAPAAVEADSSVVKFESRLAASQSRDERDRLDFLADTAGTKDRNRARVNRRKAG